jgi:hypothetical protein
MPNSTLLNIISGKVVTNSPFYQPYTYFDGMRKTNTRTDAEIDKFRMNTDCQCVLGQLIAELPDEKSREAIRHIRDNRLYRKAIRHKALAPVVDLLNEQYGTDTEYLQMLQNANDKSLGDGRFIHRVALTPLRDYTKLVVEAIHHRRAHPR